MHLPVSKEWIQRQLRSLQTPKVEADPLTLERLVTAPDHAGLDASPLQRAICRLATGKPLDDIITEQERQDYLGTHETLALLPTLIVLVAGVRGGKSFLASCAAIYACLTADLSTLKTHELPRFAIIGPTVDAARAAYKLLCGILQSSPKLRGYVDGEPTSDTVMLRRDDGRFVEIVVVAAHRGGLSVRNRWLVGFVLEEVAQFGEEATGAAVNAEEILRAAETRLLPGCQGWLISSPYGPSGLLFDLYRKWFGKPGRTLVVHAPTRALNPSFPQGQVDAVAAEQPDVAAREYGAEWVDADTAYYPASIVDPAMERADLQRVDRAVAAAIDPATRGNAWTLAVSWSERPDGQRRRVVIGAAWQWVGSKTVPLSPAKKMEEIAAILRPYGIRTVHTDSWSFDAMKDHAMAAGLNLVEHPNADRDEPYKRLEGLLKDRDIELPPDPAIRTDLIAVRKRVSAGVVRIVLPKQKDGRHCDFVPAIALAAYNAMGAPLSVDSATTPSQAGKVDAGWGRPDPSRKRGMWG